MEELAETRPMPAHRGSEARERLVASAYELFSRHGVQAVGVEAIHQRSGVARQVDEWFRPPSFEGCSFINVMLEHPDGGHALHRAAAGQLAAIQEFLAELAFDAGSADPDGLAREWHILMKGSIVAAGEGDLDAARRAQRIAALLLAHDERHRAPELGDGR
jgi:hypothetical protein